MPKLPENMVWRKDREAYYFRRKEGGKSRSIVLGRDFEEAKRRLRKLVGRDATPAMHWTVKECAAMWLRTYVPNARNAYGVRQATDRVRLHLVPALGHVLLRKLGPEHVRNYRRLLEGKDLQPVSVKHVLSDLRCMLNWSLDAGYLDRSPFPRRGMMPSLQEKRPDQLWDDEVAAVCAIEDPHGFVVRLALATGLRWGELVRLQRDDVQGGIITVHHTKSRKIRRVPLPRALQDELRCRIGKLVPFPEHGSVHFNRAVRLRSGVQRFHVHQLRHTFACRWMDRGGSLAALQQLLGHSTVTMTQRYGRVSDDLVMREARRLELEGVTRGVTTPDSREREKTLSQ